MKHTFIANFKLGDWVKRTFPNPSTIGVVVNISYNLRFNTIEIQVLFPDETKWLPEKEIIKVEEHE